MSPCVGASLFVALILAGPLPVRSDPAALPPLIRIIGALLDPGEEPGKHYPSLEVSIEGKLWELRIRTVESLTGLQPDGSLLRDIGSFLVISGPAALLESLQRQDRPGQALKIEGRLYIRSRTLLLSSIELLEPGVQETPQFM